MPSLQFWYDLASTYSYPAAMRVEALAAAERVAVVWRPFLLGPLFADQGWRDSPFNIYPVKGRYMWRDLARICEARGLPLRRPDIFPQNSLLGVRVALSQQDPGPFSRAAFVAEFGEGRDIGQRAVIADLLGADAEAAMARAESAENKAALKAAVDEARALGLPGAPCFVTPDGEVFWGDDRLEQAVAWAARGAGQNRDTAPI